MAEEDWEMRHATGAVSTSVDGDLVAVAIDLVPGTAVDLGCSTGQNTFRLAHRG